MDSMSFSTSTPVQKRLQSFNNSPLPTNSSISLFNSPLKLAEAGFTRPQTPLFDEVECTACGAKYGEWSGESPAAVHRIINPNCPFLTTPPTTIFGTFDSITSLPGNNNTSLDTTNRLENLRRQLFPDSNRSSTSRYLSVPEIKHPFEPKYDGGLESQNRFLMLFESHRYLTFTNVQSSTAALYSKGGFAYNVALEKAICVYCNLSLDLTQSDSFVLNNEHEMKSSSCPFIKLYDVGNVTNELERKVREKIRCQHFEEVMKKSDNSCSKYLIQHPEYENIEARNVSFEAMHPLLVKAFPVEKMKECGFYYTGFSDKVKCYACGVGLKNWSSVDPAVQHAKASPHCLFLIQHFGQQFISDAQSQELLVTLYEKAAEQQTEQDQAAAAASSESSTTTDPSTSTSADSAASAAAAASLTTSSPSTSSLTTAASRGSPVLDLDAIEAAEACQYTMEKIRHAIIKYFVLSCGLYPNTAILKNALSLTDENSKRVCELRHEVETTKAQKAAYQQEALCKDAELQETKAKEEAYRRELQVKHRELQELQQSRGCEGRTDLVQQIQQHLQVIQRKDQMLQRKDQMLQRKDQLLQHNQQVIEEKDQALECKDRQLEMKDKEVEDLQRHIQSLRQQLMQRELELGSSGSDDESSSDGELSTTSSDSQTEEFPIASCKVCLVKTSKVVFLPCKHVCCCDSCASRLQGKNCPICREPNQGMERVYVI